MKRLFEKRSFYAPHRPFYAAESKMVSSAIWAVFWLLVLTSGDPSIIDATIDFIGRH